MKCSKDILGILFISLVMSASIFSAATEDVSAEKKAAIKEAITQYIQKDQNLKGAFLIKDQRAGVIRELKFDYVHDGVHETDDGRYYACVDFREGEKVLDVDFFLKSRPDGAFEVSDISIHKIDGQEVGN